jgi:hypothetical protein
MEEMVPKLRDSVPALALQSELLTLSTTIRAELTAVARAGSEMLAHAFAAGEALNRVKVIVGHGSWGDWVSTEYGLSSRTAQAYMRLANHREVLEANPQHAAHLSVRAALRLIGGGMNTRKRPPASELKVTSWKTAGEEARKAFVSNIPLIEWLAAMPASWRIDLVDRIDGLRASLAKPVTQPTLEIRRAA